MRWPVRLMVMLSTLALLFVAGVGLFYTYFNDATLARYVMKKANPGLRGRLEFGSIHWSPRALVDLAMGASTEAVVDLFAVYDSRGKRVIYAPRATGQMDLNALLRGGHLVFSGIKVKDAQVLVESLPNRGPDEASIGLFDAFSPKRSTPGRGSRLEFREFDVIQAKAKFRFGSWSMDIDDLSSRGSVLYGGGDTALEGLAILHRSRASSGRLTFGDISLPLMNIEVGHLKKYEDRPTDLSLDLLTEVAGSRVRIKGRLPNLYGSSPQIALEVKANPLQPVLARLIGEGTAHGAKLSASLQGSIVQPTISARITDLGLGQGGLSAREIEGQVLVDVARRQMSVSSVKGRMMGGSLKGDGRMDLSTGEWNGRLALAKINPGHLDPVLAGDLSGSMDLKGGVRSLNKGLAVLRLKLVRQRRDMLPERISIGGSIHLSPRILDLADVTLVGDGNTLRARGSINVREKRTNIFARLDMPRLGRWLARRKIPAVAMAASSELHITGQFPFLVASGQLKATEVGYGPIRMRGVSAQVALSEGSLSLKKIRSESFGGKLEGAAKIDLFTAGDLTHPRKVPLVQASLTSSGLDLTALGASPYAIGRLFADVNISGPIDELRGTATLRVPRATVQGDRYEDSRLRLGLLGDRISIYEGSISRADGGRLSLWGDLYYDGRADLRVSTDNFPLLGVPYLSSVSLGLGGRLSGQVNISGSVQDPRFKGTLRLADAKVRGVRLGAGKVSLTPGDDGVGLKGTFFGRMLDLDGVLLMKPVPNLHLTLQVTRFPLERVIPELRRIGDVRGRASGRIRLAIDAEKGLTRADARFADVWLDLRYRPPGKRHVQTLRLANQQDLLARYDGRQLHVVQTKLVTTVSDYAGKKGEFAELTVGGWLNPDRADMRLRGRVAMQILEFFLVKRVKKLSGEATADVKLAGPLEDLSLDGSLWMHRVKVRLPKFDRSIEIPEGQIRLVPGSLHLAGLNIRVGKATMQASGRLKLERFRPTLADLRLEGDLNVKLLELMYPEHISNASGLARVRLRLQGLLTDPQFSGQLAVKHIEISPRGWGRTITLSSGKVALSNFVVKTLSPLKGTYDEGLISIRGDVRLDRWDLVDIYLGITGTGIPQRQPNVYSAEVNLNLTLMGDSEQLQLDGRMELVDVRYVRKFDIIRQAFIKPRVHEEETPFWQGSKLLENLKLNLMVRSIGQMAVKNNYAELSLSGAFSVVGTLADPRLGGQIRVEEGTFRIPFLRGDYSINRGEIEFSKHRSVDEAELNITGETLFPDRSGVDYQIKLYLQGPLNRIGIQLTSQPALEQGQIWALLATGRTTQQWRAQMRGGDTTGQSSGGSSQTAEAADAQVKQLTGEILEQIMTDPLKKITRLDLFRFEVGTESAQISAKKKLGRFVGLAGEYQIGLLGDNRAEGRLEFKMHDLLMLVGKLERLSTRLETEEEDPTRGRLELKIRLPLR